VVAVRPQPLFVAIKPSVSFTRRSIQNIVYTGAKYTMRRINNNGSSCQIVYSGTDSLAYTADCK